MNDGLKYSFTNNIDLNFQSWVAMYVDARVTVQKLDAKQRGWWKKWMTIHADVARFGHVGKKIVALGMISLISLNMVTDVPKIVITQTEGFALIFKQLIPLLTALQDFESKSNSSFFTIYSK